VQCSSRMSIDPVAQRTDSGRDPERPRQGKRFARGFGRRRDDSGGSRIGARAGLADHRRAGTPRRRADGATARAAHAGYELMIGRDAVSVLQDFDLQPPAPDDVLVRGQARPSMPSTSGSEALAVAMSARGAQTLRRRALLSLGPSRAPSPRCHMSRSAPRHQVPVCRPEARRSAFVCRSACSARARSSSQNRSVRTAIPQSRCRLEHPVRSSDRLRAQQSG
jgi:hypothetical protein